MSEHTLERITGISWPLPGDHARLYAGAGLLLVELRGDIDLAAALHVHPWLDSVAALPARLYVVDLRPATFIDSTGLAMVLRFRRRVTGADTHFGLLCTRRLHRLLRAHGTLDMLSPADTLDEVLPGWSRRSAR
ncbi:STAS domain-containing protein [Streptomyces sp. NPDC001530]|uniref:STAS domain-containing protein n=1 Tax=Streptomyces sp. NPDC001530 TaxID=3364582 RepID=UPI003683CE03